MAKKRCIGYTPQTCFTVTNINVTKRNSEFLAKKDLLQFNVGTNVAYSYVDKIPKPIPADVKKKYKITKEVYAPYPDIFPPVEYLILRAKN